MTSAYGTSAIKRERFTNAQLAELDEEIIAYVSEQNPITVRGVFYAMSVRGLVPKNDAGYRRVQRRVLELRREGELPYTWISDSTRWMRRPRVQVGLEDMLVASAELYRRDIWAESDVYVEVWCEKDALAGILLEATGQWHVPLMVSRGFASDSYLFEAAENLAAEGKPAYVYLFTDYDAAGLDIDEKIRDGFHRFAPGAQIMFQRAALSAEQVDAWNLPTRDPKPRDIARGFEQCCELDAIPPRDLINIAEELVTSHIDAERLDKLRLAEAVERESLMLVANNWNAALKAARKAARA